MDLVAALTLSHGGGDVPLPSNTCCCLRPAEVYNLEVRQVMLFMFLVQAHSVDRKLRCWKKLEAIQVIQEGCEIHQLLLE